MNSRSSLQVLTWGTLLAALAAAVLLASEDAGLPDTRVFSERPTEVLSVAWVGHRHAAPPLPVHRTREIDPRHREASR